MAIATTTRPRPRDPELVRLKRIWLNQVIRSSRNSCHADRSRNRHP
jgi:hypothetical protein